MYLCVHAYPENINFFFLFFIFWNFWLLTYIRRRRRRCSCFSILIKEIIHTQIEFKNTHTGRY